VQMWSWSLGGGSMVRFGAWPRENPYGNNGGVRFVMGAPVIHGRFSDVPCKPSSVLLGLLGYSHDEPPWKKWMNQNGNQMDEIREKGRPKPLSEGPGWFFIGEKLTYLV
jgi:hypothetical protein